MIRRYWIALIPGLLLSAAAAGADDAGLPFEIKTKRDNDKFEVHGGKDKVVLSIHSPFGISEATVKRTGAEWPAAMVLRLHLSGLERFHVSTGKQTLDASVSVDKDGVQSRVWKDGKEEAPLKKGAPFWLDFQAIDKDGKPAKQLPNKEGYFEILLPKAVFDGNPPSVTIGWIDFYRG